MIRKNKSTSSGRLFMSRRGVKLDCLQYPRIQKVVIRNKRKCIAMIHKEIWKHHKRLLGSFLKVNSVEL